MRVLAQPHALGRTAHQFNDKSHNRDSHSESHMHERQNATNVITHALRCARSKDLG